MFPLGEFTLAAAQSTITFSNIPQTYTHLQVRYIAKTSRTNSSAEDLLLRINSDSGSNYARHGLLGDGASASAFGQSSQTAIFIPTVTTSETTTSHFGVGIVDILDYKNTNKNTTVRALGGEDRNGAGNILLESGVWLNTAAVTTLAFTTAASNNFTANSQFALYGVLA
jgi:hypothetical protein